MFRRVIPSSRKFSARSKNTSIKRPSGLRTPRMSLEMAARRKTGARLRTRDFRGDLRGGGAGNSLHIGKPPPRKACERICHKSHMHNNRAVTKKAARRKTGARLRTRDFRGDLHGGGEGNSIHITESPPPQIAERIRPQPAPGAPPRRPKEKERPSAPLPSLKQSVDP